MQKIAASFIVLVLVAGCTKENKEPKRILTDMSIISTATSTTIIQGQDIVSAVKCSAPDLCYRFEKFDIIKTADRQFDIRAKATFPGSGDIVCLQAIYYADTSLRIKTTLKGQHVLNFYNGNLFAKADTVQVN